MSNFHITSTESQEGNDKINVRDILDLSCRLSRYSPAMKPFIRFSKQSDFLYEIIAKSSFHAFWDFDYTLQKILFGIIKQISSPEELEEQCNNQWRINLEPLYESSKKQLNVFSKFNIKPQFQLTHRDKFILSNLKKGDRFLYIGCGSGTECLKIASQGYHVIGIDTNSRLIEIANQWADYLKLPFQAVSMNALKLGFAADSFDGFLIEFYGYQPSFTRTIILQRELARILKKGGKGIIVANRKGYASYWYYVATNYSEKMTEWVASFSKFDFLYSLSDNSEERLQYGFYNKSHTTCSLSNELNLSFEVVECRNEVSDPRYVLGIVRPKNLISDSLFILDDIWGERNEREFSLESISEMIKKIRMVCDMLEVHELRLLSFFKASESEGAKPLTAFETELPDLINLLKEIFNLYSVTGCTSK